jgi:hypothetical protein
MGEKSAEGCGEIERGKQRGRSLFCHVFGPWEWNRERFCC